MLDIADGLAVRLALAGTYRCPSSSLPTIRIVEVIARARKSVHFQFLEKVLWQFGQEPVDDEASDDSTLTVDDQDHLFVFVG